MKSKFDSLSPPPPVATEAQTFGQGLLPGPVLSGAVWLGGAESTLRQRLSSVQRRHGYSLLCPSEGKEDICRSDAAEDLVLTTCLPLIAVWGGYVSSLWEQRCSGGYYSEDF